MEVPTYERGMLLYSRLEGYVKFSQLALTSGLFYKEQQEAEGNIFVIIRKILYFFLKYLH